MISKYKLSLVMAVLLAIGLAASITSPGYAQTTSSHVSIAPASAQMPLDGNCPPGQKTCGGGCSFGGSIEVCIWVGKNDVVYNKAIATGTICQIGIQMWVNNSFNLGTAYGPDCYGSGTRFTGFGVQDEHDDGYNVWWAQACGSSVLNGSRYCVSSPNQYT